MVSPGPAGVKAIAPGLRQSLSDLAVADDAAVVLAVAEPGDAAALAAALPALRATGLAEPDLGPAGAERLLRRLRPALVISDRFDSAIASAARRSGIALARPVQDGLARIEHAA